MKNIVRAFVVALVLTGTVAASHAAQSNPSLQYGGGGNGSTPQPQCEPGVPDGCGI